MLFFFFLNSLRLNLRNANLQAKANLRKAAQEEAINLLSYFNFFWCYLEYIDSKPVILWMWSWTCVICASLHCAMRLILFLYDAERTTSRWRRRVHSPQTQFTVCPWWLMWLGSNYALHFFFIFFYHLVLFHWKNQLAWWQDEVFFSFNLWSSRTKAGMTSAAESITESLRRTRQLMVQVRS